MSEPSDNLRFAWSQQCLWSETANRLKHGIGKARTTALGLGIGAGLLAVLAVEAAGLRSWLGRVLGFAAAAAAGLAPLVGRRAGTDQVRTWTRARSASEGLKTEVYSYLAGGVGLPATGSRLRARRAQPQDRRRRGRPAAHHNRGAAG